ncbi:hypothetical protein FQT01_11500 [Enterococcus faecalis]|nr:hypothetical protein [Enterococcus faecalis]EGO8579062.1 hypothetical protein [Enterococcus faecalis]EGO8667954.1 hypothetical protein [Enterococcus faecalis]EGO8884393.1 hypothetical protein [Enterococcus faecalis]EGO8971781.1 hypothetical protein [Enterococcus faecalis]
MASIGCLIIMKKIKIKIPNPLFSLDWGFFIHERIAS